MSQVRQDFAVKKSVELEWYIDEKVEPHCEKDLNRKKIFSLLLLPDGRLITGSTSRLQIWNIQTEQCELTFKGCDIYKNLLLLPDGRVACTDHKTIRLLNIKTELCEKTLTGHSKRIDSLLLLADGRLASTSLDRTIKVWNLKTGRCEKTIRDEDCDSHLVLLADGRMASIAKNKIKIWNLKTLNFFSSISARPEKMFITDDKVMSFLMLPDGRLVTATHSRIQIWNIETEQCEKTIVDNGDPGSAYMGLLCIHIIGCIIRLPDGRLASGSSDKTIKIWNIETGQCEKTLRGHTGYIQSLHLLPDGRLISAEHNNIKLWDIGLRQRLREQRLLNTQQCVQPLNKLSGASQQTTIIQPNLSPLTAQLQTSVRSQNPVLSTPYPTPTLKPVTHLTSSNLLTPSSSNMPSTVSQASQDVAIKKLEKVDWDIGETIKWHEDEKVEQRSEEQLTGHNKARNMENKVVLQSNKSTVTSQTALRDNTNQAFPSVVLQTSITPKEPMVPTSVETPIVKLVSQSTSSNSIPSFSNAPFNTTTPHQLIDLAKQDEFVRIDEATFLKTQADLAKLIQQMQHIDGIVLQALEGKAAELQSAINKESLAMQCEQERRVILADDKLSDYYYVFCTQFSGIWLACQTINSGKVENIEMTAIDYIPAVLDKGAEYLSFPGVALLKDIATFAIKQWSARDKKKAVSRMASYFEGIIESDTLIKAIGRQLTLAQAQSIQALKSNKAGIFKRLVNGLKDIKNKITANDIDNIIRELADKDCKKIISAIMKGELKSRPALADVSTLVKVVMGNHFIWEASTIMKSLVEPSSDHLAGLDEVKNNNSHTKIQRNLQTAQATTSNNNTAASYNIVPKQNDEQKDEIKAVHEKLKRHEEDTTALHEKINQMEKLSWQGSGAASKHDLKQTQAQLNQLQTEFKQSGIICASGNQAQMQMPSHAGKERTAAQLSDQRRMAALEAQMSLLTKNFDNLLAQQGVEMLSPVTPPTPDKQAKDEEIRKNLFKR